MDLARFVQVLRLYWWIVVASVIACVAIGALIVSLQSPRYTASTQLFVSTPSASGNLSSTYQGGLFSQQRVLSYSHVVSSPLVMRRVIARLNLPMSVKDLQREITATVPVDTVLIDVSVADRSPTRAAAIANAIGADFPGLVKSLEDGPREPRPRQGDRNEPGDGACVSVLSTQEARPRDRCVRRARARNRARVTSLVLRHEDPERSGGQLARRHASAREHSEAREIRRQTAARSCRCLIGCRRGLPAATHESPSAPRARRAQRARRDERTAG